MNYQQRYLELSCSVPLHRFQVSGGTAFTLIATSPVRRGRLVVHTLNSDDGVEPGLGTITEIKSNGQLLLAGRGSEGIPVTVFQQDSEVNPVLELNLDVGQRLEVTYNQDLGSQARMVLVSVPS